MKKEDYVSLYEYMGSPAGKELGGKVAKYAKVRSIKPGFRHISNSKYTGLVLTYPRDFIAEFFAIKNILSTNTTSLERKVSEPQDNTLPF